MKSRNYCRGRITGKIDSATSKTGVTKNYKRASIRGGAKKGRVKSVPDPPRILGLKARRTELSVTFKIIAYYQKAALLDLAQKSLDRANSDFHYHEKLPEFPKVSQDLDDNLNGLLIKLKARRRYEEELAKNRLEQNINLINRQYNDKLKDLKALGIAMVQENILYVEKMSRTGGELEEIPFQHGEDGRKVTRLAPPPKIVHPVVISFKRCQLADEKSVHKIGDNLLEQHPANFWMSCTEAQKKAITSQQVSIIEANRKIAQDEKLGIYRKRTATASVLFNPAAVPGIDMDVDEDDLQSDDIVTPEFGAPEDQNQSIESSDDAAELSLDPYGVRIPRKKIRSSSKARPNNHMIVPRFFDFEDAEGQILEDGSVGIQEIGFRNWTTKNIRNRDYFIGSDASPNPEFFFIPQRVGDINSGNNTLEDMRSVAEIARTHKLHPTLGIVLPGSVNPDYYDLEDPYFPPPTDRNRPVGPLIPHVIIQDNSDGTTTVSKVQRSWIRQTNEDFKSLETRNKVASLLCAKEDSAESKQSFSDSSNKPDVIDQELINAALAALVEREDNMIGNGLYAPLQASVKRSPDQSPKSILPKSSPKASRKASPIASPKFSHKVSNKTAHKPSHKPSPKATVKAKRRSSRPQYDPVRDLFPTHDALYVSRSCSTPSTCHKLLPQISPEYVPQQISSKVDSKMLDEVPGYASSNTIAPSVLELARKSPLNSHISNSSTPSYFALLPHTQKIQQTMHPPINMESQPTQYHNKYGSSQSLKPLSSSQGSQHLMQPHPLKQSIPPTPAYNMIMLPHQQNSQVIYPTYSSPQVAYPVQLPPPTNHATNLPPLSTFNPDVSAPAPYVPPTPSQTKFASRPLIGTMYNPQTDPHHTPQVMYASQHSPQIITAHGSLESNNFRDLRHSTQQRPLPMTLPPAPTYSWRINGNYHSHSFPQ